MRGPAKLLATTLVLLLAGRAAAAPDGDGCRAPTPQLYSNLSCPFEWGKYSCYHQGRIQQARASYEHASRHISNRSRGPCEYKGLPKNIVLVGDSTMRQVFVALGCGLLPVLSGRFVDWAERWPCHNSPNCVEGGAHSGFNVGWMALPDSKVWFVPHESVIELTRYLKSHPPPPQRRLGASAAGRRGLNATT